MVRANFDISHLNLARVDSERLKELSLFERHANIRFRNPALLNLAFVHRSHANEQGKRSADNEKLEFLGDSVLGLVVVEYLFRLLPDYSEGDLAKIKSVVVSENSLDTIARRLRLENYILISRGEENSGGRNKRAILADAMEAIIGAYFLDRGYHRARRFLLPLVKDEITKVLENRHRKDYKTLLQEYVQKRYKSFPVYSVVQQRGPEHDRVYEMLVNVNGRMYGPGSGQNKKDAEREAARVACSTLKISSDL